MSKRFIGQSRLAHNRSPRLGVVLVNLGTPEAPTPSALRRYLAEFLSDPRVVELPPLLWRIILHGIILRVRPKKSAHAYAAVWGEHGSPLMTASKALTDAVRARLSEHVPGRISVALAMRYGQPAIADVLRRLQADGVERLLIVPLYPQYSGATTGSVADGVFMELQRWRWVPELRLLGAYHDDPAYIGAIADSIADFWAVHGRSERLMISFHGMPKATHEAGDPYFCQCHKTARLIAERLALADDEWEMAFQSRFGAAEWLQPYVAERLQALPGEGVRHLSVVCPGFACDCLETLEEIAIQGKQSFLEAGGARLDYIPALNADERHATLHVERILRHAAGWPELEAEAASALIIERDEVPARVATLGNGPK
ncbi:MAG: ferrochelatase [Gammaproteobacteria bacterium]|nr:ferrochelatase [Gammaproteobacteria bacterium]